MWPPSAPPTRAVEWAKLLVLAVTFLTGVVALFKGPKVANAAIAAIDRLKK